MLVTFTNPGCLIIFKKKNQERSIRTFSPIDWLEYWWTTEMIEDND